MAADGTTGPDDGARRRRSRSVLETAAPETCVKQTASGSLRALHFLAVTLAAAPSPPSARARRPARRKRPRPRRRHLPSEEAAAAGGGGGGGGDGGVEGVVEGDVGEGDAALVLHGDGEGGRG